MFYLPEHQLGPLLGIGVVDELQLTQKATISAFKNFLSQKNGTYLFGCISYDLKNQLERLHSENPDELNFPTLHFWEPQALFNLQSVPQLIAGTDPDGQMLKQALEFQKELQNKTSYFEAQFSARTQAETYNQKFEKIKAELQQGNIYEMNYCQEFYAKEVQIKEPIRLFSKLHDLTKAPHAAYIQTPQHLVFCASPESYLQKKGSRLISKPIKGTAPRGQNASQDQQLATQLKNDPKERAENIMIVDLVRNDLSRIAKKGTVEVDELCGIYSFETVHQMISTISCELRPDLDFSTIISHTFPMGSMTGAPKIAAMKIIEEVEDFQRGLYSGTIGLIQPNGDFDFNVVIRSLIYHREKQYLSCAVGSAITIKAQPEKELEECLLKANKLIYGLQS
ncbi:MAG: hypothetical protein RLZZ65_1024 [Bacteroidota bacterium]